MATPVLNSVVSAWDGTAGAPAAGVPAAAAWTIADTVGWVQTVCDEDNIDVWKVRDFLVTVS